jgi:DNA-binding NtrC family response regulator
VPNEKHDSVRKKILVVDDEPVIRDLCVAILESHAFEAIPAADGVEGLAIYRERHEEISLTLADVTMPRMDGIELARNLFEMHSHANVILMSGYGLQKLVPDEMRSLCSVIDKPFTITQLVEAVKKCLKYDAEHYPASS